MSKITILMYHYVRDLKNSKYPEIKGCDIELFKEQIQYVQKYYKVVRMEEVIDAVRNNKKLPHNSILLTFDDAYKDHYDFVFPVLDELGIQGSFFPAAKPILEHTLLDVNKIHFLLASIKNKKQIVSHIHSMMDKFKDEYSLEPLENYENIVKNEKYRFDTPEVVFIKIMLQRELPEKLRTTIVDSLFNKYVSKDENSFSRELYTSIDQLKCMKKNGMFIGSHGYSHTRLGALTKEDQKKELKLSIKFLKELGCDKNNFVFCYPYGSYNESFLSILKENGCNLALVDTPGLADLNKNQNFTLPRLDTNDLPKDKSASPNKWTQKIINS